MNTAFKRWGSKFVVTKVQQFWKRSFQERKVLKYTKCHAIYSGYDYDVAILRNTFSNTKYLQSPVYSIYFSSRQAVRLLSISKNRCWNCNAVVTERDLVCMSCGSVQEPRQNLNYFEIFKETPHFDIDTRNLTVKFRRLQNLLHPDKIASRPEKERAYSAEQSALVNKAYQTLLRPIDRGLYLLELHSKPLSEDEIQLPSDFLANIMEVNEVLDECNSADILESIRHVNDAKLQILFSDVSLAFKEKNIDKARESLCKLKYYINIDEKIRELEEELGVSRDD
ncbi:iron-sulfur cluster co-chaperone protein HscB-like [Argiope bruennichi]|uniref:Iron-sulfur cluster co-chaperone protein HscB like protein n=1 Tax=Argiope bruennichi TaxID=94029 RepID=A0A8T0E8X4_ARGBR|nr:iron-sulfur cluster co-chaperone protein HscB-like [Argiope bruennichi]KAF8766705.1 Iron-sulfur cluster co-chaperone protein HscB like protein [Argiope bruennichi]